MTLLQQMDRDRRQQRERLRCATLDQLRAAWRDTIAPMPVIVFGSVLKAGRFDEASDVDLALESEPLEMSIYQLSSLLAERLGRRVDIVLLAECRFAQKILREG